MDEDVKKLLSRTNVPYPLEVTGKIKIGFIGYLKAIFNLANSCWLQVRYSKNKYLE